MLRNRLRADVRKCCNVFKDRRQGSYRLKSRQPANYCPNDETGSLRTIDCITLSVRVQEGDEIEVFRLTEGNIYPTDIL